MKKSLLSIICLMFSMVTFALDGNHYNYVPKSPEAAAFDRVPDIPVSNYTGSMSFSIPLYTLECGDIILPITLDYQGNAIPVRQEATWVGLNWLFLPSKSVHVHTANGDRTIQENYSYDYDHAGRLVKTTYGINGSPQKILSTLDYDDLGRVFTQTLLDKESVAYFYNIRNWKTDIIGQNFSQSLAYNHNNGSLIPRKSLFNATSRR